MTPYSDAVVLDQKPPLKTLLTGCLVLIGLGTAAVAAAFAGGLDGGRRDIGALVIGGILLLCGIGPLLGWRTLRRPVWLVVDAAGIRWDDPRRRSWMLGWDELSAVRVQGDSLVQLVLVPANPSTARFHPEISHRWEKFGVKEAFAVPLGQRRGQVPVLMDAIGGFRPDLLRSPADDEPKKRRKSLGFKRSLAIFGVMVAIYGVGLAITVVVKNNETPEPERTPFQAADPAVIPLSGEIKAKTKGWRGVGSYQHGIAYDVPQGWDILSRDTIIGFESATGQILAAMSGTAEVEEGECRRAGAGVTGGDKPLKQGSADLPALAQKSALRWAKSGWTPEGGAAPGIQLSLPRTMLLGGLNAAHVRADVTVNGVRGKCDPEAATLHIVTFATKKGRPITFVLYAEHGTGVEVTAKTLQKVVTSLRPFKPAGPKTAP